MDTLPNKSYWIDSTPTINYSSLNGDISVDVAVIGGGITGITTALLLKKEGVKVALIWRSLPHPVLSQVMLINHLLN